MATSPAHVLKDQNRKTSQFLAFFFWGGFLVLFTFSMGAAKKTNKVISASPCWFCTGSWAGQVPWKTGRVAPSEANLDHSEVRGLLDRGRGLCPHRRLPAAPRAPHGAGPGDGGRRAGRRLRGRPCLPGAVSLRGGHAEAVVVPEGCWEKEKTRHEHAAHFYVWLAAGGFFLEHKRPAHLKDCWTQGN